MIMQKNLPLSEVYFQLIIRFFIDFVAWIQFLLKGKPEFALSVTKAHYQFLKNLQKTGRKRTGVQLPYCSHTGVYKSSIVWSFFIRGIRHFSRLTDF
jgi:hypothetical protein